MTNMSRTGALGRSIAALSIAYVSFAGVAACSSGEDITAGQVQSCSASATPTGFTALKGWWEKGNLHTPWIGSGDLDILAAIDDVKFEQLKSESVRYVDIALGRLSDGCGIMISKLKAGAEPNVVEALDEETKDRLKSGDLQLFEIVVSPKRG